MAKFGIQSVDLNDKFDQAFVDCSIGPVTDTMID